MSNIKKGRYKPRVHVSVNLFAGAWPPSCATLSSSLSCVRATNNTANHDNHKKVNSWVSFSFLNGYGVSSGLPELRYENMFFNEEAV